MREICGRNTRRRGGKNGKRTRSIVNNAEGAVFTRARIGHEHSLYPDEMCLEWFACERRGNLDWSLQTGRAKNDNVLGRCDVKRQLAAVTGDCSGGGELRPNR